MTAVSGDDATSCPGHCPGPADRPSLSFEFFPPRTPDVAEATFAAVRQLEHDARPDFVSVTFGASGTKQNGSHDLVARIAAETRLPVLAHLTCVTEDRAQLARTITRFLAEGAQGFLALRGDLPLDDAGRPVPLRGGANGFRHADELVRQLRADEPGLVLPEIVTAPGKCPRYFRDARLTVAVAAFPTGHPESSGFEQDVAVLAAKQAAGADFAITQHFFSPEDYFGLVRAARLAGVTLPIVPGLMPVTSVPRLERIERMSGSRAPRDLAHALAAAESPAERRRLGVAATVDLTRRLVDGGAPGLHLFTLNQTRTTFEILDGLDSALAA